MTKIRLLGDHADLHCGCAAVTEAIHAMLAPHGDLVGQTRDFDVLVVNGEGSMHHGRAPFLSKMTSIARAQKMGRPTYLINSLWQQNPGGFDDVLEKLDGICLRGPASARDLYQRHGLIADHAIDLSVQAPIDDSAPTVDYRGRIVATDAWTPSLGFVHLPRIKALDWVDIDMTKIGWSSLVRSLPSARLLLAGRHHAVYAAVKARCPFVPIRGNSHKIEDLLEAAGSPIPIANTLQEAATLAGWAERNRAAYDDLFDWVEAQPRWKIEGLRPASREGDPPPAAPAPVARAQAAIHARDFETADAAFAEATRAFKGRVPSPRLAAMAAAGVGDAARALSIVADAREAKPEAFAFVKTLHQFSRDLQLWTNRNDAPRWWVDMREAALAADLGQTDEATALAGQAITRIEGTGLATAARFMLACRMLPLRQQALARHLLLTLPVPDALPEHVAQEQLFFFSETREFGRRGRELAENAETLDAWADPSFRHRVLSYRTLLFGPTEDEIARRRAAVEAFPTNALLRQRLISDASEAGDFHALDIIPEAELLAAAPRNLRLAAHLHKIARGRFPKHYFLWQHMEEERAALMERLADRKRATAVVGNSPIELGKGQGRRIDGYDEVIRFNDFDTSAPFDADYGSKTTVHVQTYPIYFRADAARPPEGALLVQRNAFNIFEPRDWTPVLEAFEDGQRITWLDRSTYLAAANAIGGPPSAGLSLAHLMRGLRGPLKRRDFFGFSFVDQLYGDNKAHYFNDERPSLMHDWAREAAHFETLFAPH